MNNTYAVIIAGGAGTRFWPASRHERPKQLLPLGGHDRRSLLAMTRQRIGAVTAPERTLVVTAARLVEATRAELPEIPPENILAEPVPRNTAAAIGWATALIEKRAPDALIGVYPSDHYITDEESFEFVLGRAFDGARAGFLTTVGIVPTRPETGYGYIERGAELESGLYRANRFIEKPIRPVAEEYIAGKRHLWNAGMFFFRGPVMLAALQAQLPELFDGIESIQKAAGTSDEEEVLRRVFPTLPTISIDHGVMERAPQVAVVPGDFGWSDVGSWQSSWELTTKDAAGNALPTGSIAIDSAGNLVCDLTTSAPKRCFALVGVSGMIVVETDDAVLIIPRERAQDVRAVVEALQKRGETRLL